MPKNPDNSQSSGFWREALRVISLGWDMAIPIFAGVLAGHFLDRWFATRYIFTLGLLILGIFISYYILARVIKEQNQKDESPDDKKDRNGQ